MGHKINITESGGNVFADLQVAEPELALAKAELAQQITAIIRGRHLSQRKAAEVLGVDQPMVSALFHGRLSSLFADQLLRLLNALGQDVEIHVRPKAASKPTIHVVGEAGRD